MVVEGESSRAIAVKARQHEAAVEFVSRPMCFGTTLICLRVQLAISGQMGGAPR